MTRRKMKFALAIMAACAIGAAAAPLVQAVTDTDDSIGAVIGVKFKSNTDGVFKATIAGIPVTVTCTKSSTAFTLASNGAGLGPISVTHPAFSGCTDSLGGTDTVTSNTTHGAWRATFIDAANDETAEAPGDQLKLAIPQAGQTITSSAVAGCTITVAPSGPASISGAYDDKGTLTFTGAPIPFATNAGCPGGAATGTATFDTALTPTGTGTPGYGITPAIRDVG